MMMSVQSSMFTDRMSGPTTAGNIPLSIVPTSSTFWSQELQGSADSEDFGSTGSGGNSNNSKAMQFSQKASGYLRAGKYAEALDAYTKAAEFYEDQTRMRQLTEMSSPANNNQNRTKPAATSAVVAAVNAAGCYRNMGAVSRLMNRFDLGVQHLQRAEDFYMKSKHIVEKEASKRKRSRLPLLRSASEESSEVMCLDAMVLETLQSRATFHFQYQKDVRKAVICHEEVIKNLIRLEDLQVWENIDLHSVYIDGVRFTPITKEQHCDLLIHSLENLVGLYRAEQEMSGQEEEQDMENLLDAFDILQSRKDENPDDEKILLALTHVARNLSEIFFDNGELDRAVDFLHDAMDIKLSMSEEPSEEALEAMDKMGLASEQMGNYDKALECYEKALLARSRFFGEKHIDVAKSLVNVARVMELQGNSEGGLDLYKAAHAIYAEQITSNDFDCEEEDAELLLNLVPTAMEQGRYKEAAAYLTKCLAVAEDRTAPGFANNYDRSQIYFDLGKAYMGMKDYVSATICLVEAAKEEGNVREEQVYALLKQVEDLQREENSKRELSNILASHSGSGNLEVNNDPTLTCEDLEINDDPTLTYYDSQSQISSDQLGQSSTGILVESSKIPASNNLAKGLPNVHKPANSSRSKTLPPSFNKFYANGKPNEPELTLPDDINSSYHGFDDPFFDTASISGFHDIPQFDGVTQADAFLDGIFIDEVPREDGFMGAGTQKTDSSSIFHETKIPSEMESPSISIDSVPDEKEHEKSDLSNSNLALLASPRPVALSDQEKFAETIELNQSKTGRTGRGLRISISSPRRSRDEKSISSSQQQSQTQQPQNRGTIGKSIAEKLRRARRQGFKSLPEEKVPDSIPEPLEDPIATEEESLLEFTGPMEFVTIKRTASTDSAISQITLRVEDPNSSRDNSQEWWWGVTAEGFGRWFPASYFSQAVEAADAFLSAKAIHNQSKAKASEKALNLNSDEDTNDGDGVEVASQDIPEFASHVGIAGNKTVQGNVAHAKPIDVAPDAKATGKSFRSPRHESVFSSPSPRHFIGGKDIASEIAAARDALAKKEKEFGSTHPSVSTCLFTLAVLYSRDRDIDPAIECAKEALRIQKRNNSVDDTIRSLHFLADLYLHQKQYKQSMTYYKESLEFETTHFGYTSDAVAKTLNCIGTVKSMQNEFPEAMKGHEEALRILKDCHGEDLTHPLVTETLCHIGSVYYRERNSLASAKGGHDKYTTFIEAGMLEVIGKAHEDRGSYKMALAFFEEKLQFLESKGKGRENLEDAATTLNGLGMLSARAGLLVEAADYYERALSIQLQLGCEEVHVATARVLTAAVQFQMGYWQKALSLLKEALTVLEDELGPEHETVAATLYQLGMVQSAFCEYDVAMEMLNQALDIQHERLGDDHPATLRTRREIGNLYAVYEEEVDAAFDVFDQVLGFQKQSYGDRHPNIAETLHSIGTAYFVKGEYASALQVLEECYYMRVEFLGWDHPLQATTLHDIAKIHLKRGRIKKALHICDVVLGIRQDCLSERHIDIARVLLTKGSCLINQGDTSNAKGCLFEALDIVKETVGERHPLIADIYSEIGCLHLRNCQFEDARNEIQRALDIYSMSNVDVDYPGIKDAKEKLDRVERDEMLCV